MDKTILDKVRKLNWVLQESTTGAFSFDELATILSELVDGNVYIIDINGGVVGVHYTIVGDSIAIGDPDTGHESLPKEYNDELLKVTETRPNMKGDEALVIFKYDYDTYDKLVTVIPIFGGRERVGTLFLSRYSPEFNEEDILLGEYGATVVGLEIKRIENLKRKEEERVKKVVQKAIATLSYSEVEAVQQIFAELDGNEGLLIASKIADRSGITRSVIVNALRKLESAGVIDSRSLGMKGTHIKILNDVFISELSKAKF
ncbi:MAG: GTP-sensing pleiotropic transcriptional regulator CodY [Clostridiales Family XIII bacterium]|jgi:transcriptional pleiotropic repressor|nr:GTP-sensing pleiotropic transcriptional regulator CodY [Clostridiales Family XIII bacterium]